MKSNRCVDARNILVICNTVMREASLERASFLRSRLDHHDTSSKQQIDEARRKASVHTNLGLYGHQEACRQ